MDTHLAVTVLTVELEDEKMNHPPINYCYVFKINTYFLLFFLPFLFVNEVPRFQIRTHEVCIMYLYDVKCSLLCLYIILYKA